MALTTPELDGMVLSVGKFAKAFTSNQLARLAPRLYVKLTRQTGRGSSETETPENIARYFQQCVADYFEVLNVTQNQQADFLDDKVVLEYGPGDLPGVALLLVAQGARKVYCVDRFPMVTVSEKNIAVIEQLATLLPQHERQRLHECFRDPRYPGMGFCPDRIEYIIRPNGLSGLTGAVDLVISRAVLEHVNDLESTFSDMWAAMRSGALSVHQVDLKSHGLHDSNPLDFLVHPSWLWNLMYSEKGVPNRWRVNRYRDIISGMPFKMVTLSPKRFYTEEDIAAIRSSLAKPFRNVSDQDLAWKEFWLILRRER